MIEAELIKHAQKHFAQADKTPFTISPLDNLIGKHGTSQKAMDIMDGLVDIDSLSALDATRKVLQQMERPPTLKNVPPICTKVTVDDVAACYRNWSEGTSTSPSGRHLGHARALIAHNGLPPDSDDPVAGFGLRMLAINTALLNIAIETGYCFLRWCYVINCLLEKDCGRPRITRLRIIHLYEADYNLILKILWRRLIKHADDHDALQTDQWGSRPGRSCNEVVVFKQLTYMMSHMLHMPLACFDNDAAACYDRIIPPMAMMACQRLGMSAAPCVLNATMLQNARYRIKTQLGISELYFYYCVLWPLFGTGQGSGNSPAIWLAVSILII